MRYPSLVPHMFCKTPCTIEIVPEGVDKYGNPEQSIILKKKCMYQSANKVDYTKEKKQVIYSGKAYFNGDIYPKKELFAGNIIINGTKYEIENVQKHRNTDGTVNYTTITMR